MSADAQTAKRRMRRQIRLSRSQRSADERAQHADSLRSLLSDLIPPAAVVAAYSPTPDEPDVLPFLTQHNDGGGAVFLPVTPDGGSRVLGWSPWTQQTTMRRHARLPLNEPDTGSQHVSTLAELISAAADHDPVQLVILVPCLAVTTDGGRLGQGGGFYDTTLSSLREGVAAYPRLQCQVIGVVFSDEVCAPGTFPVLAHDLRVDLVATEKAILPL